MITMKQICKLQSSAACSLCLLLVSDHTLLYQVRYLNRHPGSQTKSHCMSNTKFGSIPAPQGLEVVGEANLSSSVHLCCLPIQLRQGNLRACHRVGHRYVKLNVKLVLQLVVIVPTFAKPASAFFIRLKSKPVIVRLLVV